MKALPCTADDFSRTPATQAIFEANKDKEMATFCPSLSEYSNIEDPKERPALLGTRAALV